MSPEQAKAAEEHAKAASLRVAAEHQAELDRLTAARKRLDREEWRDLWRFGGCMVAACVLFVATLGGLVWIVVKAARLAWGAS